MFFAMEPLKSPWQYGDFCIIKKPKSIDGHIFKEFLSSFYGVVGLIYLLFIAIVFFVAFPNKEKGGVLTCDRLLYTQINQLSCLFWQRFTFFEGFSGVIFFCLTTKLQHESSSTLAPVIFATLNYLDYYHETSKQLSLWDLVCYCLLLIFPQKMSTVEVWFWLRWLKKLYLLYPTEYFWFCLFYSFSSLNPYCTGQACLSGVIFLWIL